MPPQVTNPNIRYIFYQSFMKAVQISGIAHNGDLFFYEGSTLKRATIQGITLIPSAQTRQTLKDLSFNNVEWTSAKGNKLRTKDFPIILKLIASGAATLNKSEINESKFYSEEEKSALTSQEVTPSAHDIRDYCNDRRLIREDHHTKKTKNVKIEALEEQILISFEEEGRMSYLPAKLKNIDHYFQLVDKVTVWNYFGSNLELEATLYPACFNLAKRRFQIEVQLPVEVEKEILSHGWGVVSLKNLVYLSAEKAQAYKKFEMQAKANHQGIFKKPFQILSLIYTKNNLVCKVEKVIEGYILMVRTKADEQMKIELAKIYCPIQGELGAFECREFARKHLIGKDVNVFLKKDQGLNIQGSIVRFSDNKDIETLMVENGYGFVKEELKGTMLSGKLQNLQKKAREAKKGVHNEKLIGTQSYDDLTLTHNKKDKNQKKQMIENKVHFLQTLEPNDEGVIESIEDVDTYIVRVDRQKKILRVKLDGVSKLVGNPKLEPIMDLKKRISEYLKQNFVQRTVILDVNDFDQTSNSFSGILRLQGKGKDKISLQQVLLQEGFVFINRSGYFEDSWIEIEEKAMAKACNVWSENLRCLGRQDLLKEQEKHFKGKISWVENGEICYVQPETVYNKLDMIDDQLNKHELKVIAAENIVPDYLCAAEYMEVFCRAKILSGKVCDYAVSKQECYVYFIDWGNKQMVKAGQLREIPHDLQYIPPLCCQVLLDIVKPTKLRQGDHLQNLREAIMAAGECKFIKTHSQIVNIYTETGEHLNVALVEEGLMKADLPKVSDEAFRAHLEEVMESLRKNLVGIWDVEEDEETIDQLDYL